MNTNEKKSAGRPVLNQVFETEILRLGMSGEGVAQPGGYTVFMDAALPGEKVKARLIESRKAWGRARLLEVRKPSQDRRPSLCPVFGQCGGCKLLHLNYPVQLAFKRQRVIDELRKIGGLEGVDVRECLAAPQKSAYRNKIEVPCRPVKGRLMFGFYRPGSHYIVPFETCAMHCAKGEEVFRTVREAYYQSGLPGYDETAHTPGLRHLLVRTSEATGESLVVFITNGWELTGLDRIAKELLQKVPGLKGVFQNNNPVKGNIILGPECRLLAGAESMVEEVASVKFRLGPLSFFQINTAQAEQLARLVTEAAALTGTETLLDAYCGAGFFSLILAKQAKEVLGIETVAEAVEEAKKSAELNGINNVRFMASEVEKALATLTGFDVAIVDPPRKGCEPIFLEALIKAAPARLIYVSCNPATLARDLKILTAGGYAVEYVQPLDMFPQTPHVECVVRLTKNRTTA